MQRNSPRFLRRSVGTDLALQCGLLLAVLLFGTELLPVVHGQMNKEEAGGSPSDDSLSQTHAENSDSDDTEPCLGSPSFEPNTAVYEEIPFSTGDAIKTPSADSEHGTKPPLLISKKFFSSKFPDVYIPRLIELSDILSSFLMTMGKIKSARRIVKNLLELSQQAESYIQKNAPKSVQLGEHEGPSVDLMSYSEQPSDSVEQQATSVPPGELENAEKSPAGLLATCNQQKSQLEKELQEINATYKALLAATNVSQQEHDDERKRLNTSLQQAWEQRTQLQNACQENDKTIASLNEEVRTKTVALDSVEQQLKEQINAMQQQADTHVATHASLTADAELQKRQSMIIYAVLDSVILLLCVIIVVLSCWVHHRRLNDITSSSMLLDSDTEMIRLLFDDSE